ncbi:MAG: hypothetical protein J6U26_05420, partial [Lachnospiraceae bacterium]|nr:hypothetical protein [Lachnospiraceae bacterium]
PANSRTLLERLMGNQSTTDISPFYVSKPSSVHTVLLYSQNDGLVDFSTQASLFYYSSGLTNKEKYWMSSITHDMIISGICTDTSARILWQNSIQVYD